MGFKIQIIDGVEKSRIEGYWAGGKFFEGKPQEGVLEKQMEQLQEAKKTYAEINKKLGNEDEDQSIFAPKSDKSGRKKSKGAKNPEDVFHEKKKADKLNSRKGGGEKMPDLDTFKPKCEDEMDLIEEQAKKNPYQQRGVSNHLNPKSTKYFIDDLGFVQFPDGSKYKGALVNGNPSG